MTLISIWERGYLCRQTPGCKLSSRVWDRSLSSLPWIQAPRFGHENGASLKSQTRRPVFMSVSSLRSTSLGPYTEHIILVFPASMYAEPLAWLISPQRANTGRTSPSPLPPSLLLALGALSGERKSSGDCDSSGPRIRFVSTGIFNKTTCLREHYFSGAKLFESCSRNHMRCDRRLLVTLYRHLPDRRDTQKVVRGMAVWDVSF